MSVYKNINFDISNQRYYMRHCYNKFNSEIVSFIKNNNFFTTLFISYYEKLNF